ncbi:MAG: GIY-YIG nuclease family protein [Planctomycetota bacterium]|nr:MAG: GIY-YIG nuclease family protein [Planctomycetota bacterium]
MGGWFLYLVRCGDGSLYTGVATDVERRLAEHRAGRGARYLRGRGPLELVFAAEVGDRGRALRAERRVKRLDHAGKEALLADPGRLAALLADCRRPPTAPD